uniref:Meiosis-specific protein hop1 n=1 Tax=Lygus hesperus TaxID=30085 RepID=A0A0A9XSR1_LYGHE
MSIENQIECIDENETKSDAGPPHKKISSADLRKTAILNTIQSKRPVDAKSPIPSVANEKSSAPQTTKINVNCVCSMNTLKTGIFQCTKCSDWHHLVCYRRKPTTIVNSSCRVACVKCAADNQDSECLDSSLVSKKVPMEMIEKIAVFRQMVFKLRWFAVISTSTLVDDCQVSLDKAKNVIDKLMKKKLLTPSTRKGDYNVNTSLLIAFINGYFR